MGRCKLQILMTISKCRGNRILLAKTRQTLAKIKYMTYFSKKKYSELKFSFSCNLLFLVSFVFIFSSFPFLSKFISFMWKIYSSFIYKGVKMKN